MVNDCFDNHVDVGDPATSGRDSDGLAGFNSRTEMQLRKLIINFARNVVHSRRIELLPHTKNLRIIGHGGFPSNKGVVYSVL